MDFFLLIVFSYLDIPVNIEYILITCNSLQISISFIQVTARQAYDSKGQPTVQTEVYCTIKNEEKVSNARLWKDSLYSDGQQFYQY
jgi:hypothetical protein